MDFDRVQIKCKESSGSDAGDSRLKAEAYLLKLCLNLSIDLRSGWNFYPVIFSPVWKTSQRATKSVDAVPACEALD